MKVFVIIVVLFITACQAQLTRFGRCPSITPVSDFDVDQYLGLWFEIQSYEQKLEGECVTADFYSNSNGKIDFVNSLQRPPSYYLTTVYGTASLSYPNEVPLRGILTVSFDGMHASDPNYNIIATDYSSYAVVYNCVTSWFFFKRESAWILSRMSELSAEAQAAVNQATSGLLNPLKLRTTNQNPQVCEWTPYDYSQNEIDFK